jgi:hypothetical protein
LRACRYSPTSGRMGEGRTGEVMNDAKMRDG